MDGDKSAQNEVEKIPVNEMTSKDYYFDSYAHFGIHEVTRSPGEIFFLGNAERRNSNRYLS